MKYVVASLFSLLSLWIGVSLIGSDDSTVQAMSIPFLLGTIAFGVLAVWQYRVDKLHDRQRKARIDEFKHLGFKPTHRLMINRQLFAIDANSKRWLILDYENPLYCMMHDFSEITSFKRQESSERVTTSTRSKGLLGRRYHSTSHNVHTKLGVLITLNNLSRPTEYINCLGSESSVDEILAMLQIIKG